MVGGARLEACLTGFRATMEVTGTGDCFARRSSDGARLTMQPYTLALEGATYEGSVALLRESKVVSERPLTGDNGHPQGRGGERLMPAVAECISEVGVRQ